MSKARGFLIGCAVFGLGAVLVLGGALAVYAVLPVLEDADSADLNAVAGSAGQALDSRSGGREAGADGPEPLDERATDAQEQAASARRAASGAAAEPADVPLASLSGVVRDLSDLYAAVSPGVVSIRVTRSSGPITGAADGSGWVYDGRHIVTNNHVVSGGRDIVVRFNDGSEEPATVVGTDDDSDLAVIRVEDMPPAAVALPLVEDFEALEVGQPVIAIGNPFGLQSTITAGIISALGRTIPAEIGSLYSIPQTIQTDAAINPGNSGGPLLNLRGEVVGINAQIRTSGTASNSGVGFAIPASIAAKVVPTLIAEGEYVWSFLGVSGGDVTLDIAEANNLGKLRGAYIGTVVSNGPSDGLLQGGSGGDQSLVPLSEIEGGDVVVAIDDAPVESFADLLTYVALETRPGDVVQVTVLRDGREQVFDVTMGERPDN